MYNKLLFRSLFVGVYFLALAACSDDDKEIAPGHRNVSLTLKRESIR